MNENNLIRLNEGQVKAASEVLTRAYYDYPPYAYLFPNLDERSRNLPVLFEALLRFGVMYGEVYGISAKLEGVARWLPYWEAETTEEKIIQCLGGKRQRREFASIMGLEFFKRLGTITKHMERCQKQYANFSHWYLGPIGVDPVYQGRGYASLLLKAKLAELDKENVSCYLETNTDKNIAIYQHLGFEVVEEGVFPDTNVPIWIMMRKNE